MSFEGECALLEARFGSSWATATPIDWDNVPYKPVAGTAFVSVKVVNGFAAQAAFGSSSLYRSDGVFSISIFTPLDNGRKNADLYADKACAIFRGWSSSGLTCRAPYVTRVGEFNGWYQLTIAVPYFRDEYI